MVGARLFEPAERGEKGMVKPEEAQENAALHVRPVTIEDGMTVASWHYPGPWAVNDNLEAPGPDGGFCARTRRGAEHA
jgi:hypothetical protein